jgi:hypothetical protein
MKLKNKFLEKLLILLSEEELIECVEIADDHAIEFYHWMLNNDTQDNAEKWFHYTDRDMLNTFKEEKGL